MAIRFQIEVQGEKILDRAFNRLELATTDLTDVWKEVRRTFYDIEQDNFQSENAKGMSGHWKPLSPKYAEIKRKTYGRFLDDINIRTERTYKSLTREGAPDAVYEAGKTEMTIGTSVPYAIHIQKVRPIIDPSDDQKRQIQKAIQKGLVKQVRGSGFVMDASNYRDFG